MEQEEKYYVYLHRNKINNKKYYGITSEKRPEIRWRKGYSHNAHFQNAIKKYGWDNFEHVILFDDLSKNEAEEKEKYLITRDNTTNPNNGYNLTSGGGLGVFRHSERSKQLMSEHTKGELNPMYGKTHSETTKMKIKSRLTNHPNTSKKVLCEETGLIYRSTREVERLTGIKHTCINEAALPDGNQNTAGGYHWVYIKEENNMEQIITSLLETDALDAWVKEYGVLNGIALTDTITTDCFLKDFQLTYATLFSGVRHDSGDPYEWGEKVIAHYESLGINPKTKTLLFSDSLDFERADKLFRHFHDRVNVAFGIGTYLSNDTDVPALNIVMKTTKCNGMDVAKVSDVTGKGMCKNPEYVDYLNRCIDWRMSHE